jgi:hypothetical protein
LGLSIGTKALEAGGRSHFIRHNAIYVYSFGYIQKWVRLANTSTLPPFFLKGRKIQEETLVGSRRSFKFLIEKLGVKCKDTQHPHY